jgi:hypothetical protein
LLLRGQQMKIFSHFLAEDFSGVIYWGINTLYGCS